MLTSLLQCPFLSARQMPTYTGGLLSLSLRAVMRKRGGTLAGGVSWSLRTEVVRPPSWALGAEASAYSNEEIESPSPFAGLLTAKQRQFYMTDERL